ncbi:hypothetical protein D6D25_04851, partial [Aureobasidium pullulans]
MTNRSEFSAWKLQPHIEQAPLLDLEYLRGRASWIRDELDPVVAREGPDTLRPDTVVILFKFFEQLRTSYLTLEYIRDSRIHLALIDIAGRATRWPVKLIDEAEEIILRLEKDWWINTMFAFHDGIIANVSSDSCVTTCFQQAYALLLADGDELECDDPAHFTYRSTSGDARRYRLCAGTLASRQPVRVLRSHTLRSFFAPRAGVRYDGMYKVSGWRIIQDPKTKAVHYHIRFDRLPSEPPIGPVLEHPTAEEIDDYREYKRIRKDIRKNRNYLRHGLRFGTPNPGSCSTHDEVSILDKPNSAETTPTIKKPTPRRKPSTLYIHPEVVESPPKQDTPANRDGYRNNGRRMSVYHYQIVLYLAWLSSSVHLSALTLLRPFLNKLQGLRAWRLLGMIVLFFMLIVGLVPTVSYDWGTIYSPEADTSLPDTIQPTGWGIPAICFWGKTYGDGFNDDAPIGYLILIFSYVWKMGDLFVSPRNLYNRTIRRPLENFIAKTLSVFARRYMQDGNALWLWCFRGLLVIWIPLVAFMEAMASFSASLWLSALGLVFGTIQIVIPRYQNLAQTAAQESEWGFGQLVPLVLLVQPIGAISEHAWIRQGETTESNISEPVRRQTTGSSTSDHGPESEPLVDDRDRHLITPRRLVEVLGQRQA